MLGNDMLLADKMFLWCQVASRLEVFYAFLLNQLSLSKKASFSTSQSHHNGLLESPVAPATFCCCFGSCFPSFHFLFHMFPSLRYQAKVFKTKTPDKAKSTKPR